MNAKEFMSCQNIYNVLVDVKNNLVISLNKINTGLIQINSIM
jgi:hypothetical protein